MEHRAYATCFKKWKHLHSKTLLSNKTYSLIKTNLRFASGVFLAGMPLLYWVCPALYHSRWTEKVHLYAGQSPNLPTSTMTTFTTSTFPSTSPSQGRSPHPMHGPQLTTPAVRIEAGRIQALNYTPADKGSSAGA